MSSNCLTFVGRRGGEAERPLLLTPLFFWLSVLASSMDEALSENLSASRRLNERLKSSVAAAQKTVERSLQLIEESCKVLDRSKRYETRDLITTSDTASRRIK
jgi:hypothetical protein